MGSFLLAFNNTKKWEGLYSDHQYDPGGKTKYGITEKIAKKHGLVVKYLTEHDAMKIYHADFFDKPRLYFIDEQNICNYVFDMCVNHGIKTGVKIFQKAIYYIQDKIKIDGVVGIQTLGLYKGIKRKNILLYIMRGLRINFYLKIIDRNKKMRVFRDGWIRRAMNA